MDRKKTFKNKINNISMNKNIIHNNMSDEFNYWNEEQYFPKCTKCGQPYNYNTRWCSKDCWINQRYKQDNNNNNYYEDDFMNYDNYKNTDDFMHKTEYDILQIEPPIDETKIKKQYHKLSLKHHPDKGGDKNEFIKINQAYNKLLLVC